MSFNQKLKERSQNLCELCATEIPKHEYTVSPKNVGSIDNQVAICNTCLEAIDNKK